MKILCKLIGGSHLYGLNTPASDYDERYVFMHDDIARTIGLDRYEHQDERGGEEDKFGFELRHYLGLLRKTNTQVLEILFAEDFIGCHPLFKSLIIDNKYELIDSEQMFKSLRGYIQGEKALANGERTGKLGKRKDAIEKYGFSPKNFTQLFRLAHVGIRFFGYGAYPVNIARDDPKFAKWLLDIKLHPENHKKEDLNKFVDIMEETLICAFANRSETYKFNEKLANEILLEFYTPMVCKLYGEFKLR